MTLSELEKACRELREKSGDMPAVIEDGNRAYEVFAIDEQIYGDLRPELPEQTLIYAVLKPGGKAVEA